MPPIRLLIGVILVFAVLLIAGCGEVEEFDSPAGGTSPTSTPEATTTPTPHPPVQSPEVIVETQDTHGSASNESTPRLDLMDEFGPLGAILEEHETATFAMATIEHDPELRFVLYFTDNGEDTIRKYVDPDSELFSMIEIREAHYSLSDLHALYDETRAIFEQLGNQWWGGSTGDVLENSISIFVYNSEQVYQMLEDAGLELPERVTLAGDGPPVSFEVPEEVPGIYIAIRKPTLGGGDYPDALLAGTLVLEGGCLLVDSDHGEGYLLPIWHPDHRLQVDGERIEVVNRDGDVIARVGEPVWLGGAGGSGFHEGINDSLHYPIPDSCPADGSWGVGGVDPLAEQPVTPTPVPEGTPFGLHNVEWPADFANVHSLLDAMPDQIAEGGPRWVEPETSGRIVIGYGPQDGAGVPKLVITDLTTGTYFPDYWTANDLMASQFMGAGGLAIGVHGDVTWASEDTNHSGRTDRYDTVPVHAINWGASDGRLLFTASAEDYSQLEMLVAAVVGAVE